MKLKIEKISFYIMVFIQKIFDARVIIYITIDLQSVLLLIYRDLQSDLLLIYRVFYY